MGCLSLVQEFMLHLECIDQVTDFFMRDELRFDFFVPAHLLEFGWEFEILHLEKFLMDFACFVHVVLILVHGENMQGLNPFFD